MTGIIKYMTIFRTIVINVVLQTNINSKVETILLCKELRICYGNSLHFVNASVIS